MQQWHPVWVGELLWGGIIRHLTHRQPLKDMVDCLNITLSDPVASVTDSSRLIMEGVFVYEAFSGGQLVGSGDVH